MEITCLAPKITGLTFLKQSLFYAGVYCISGLLLTPGSHEKFVFLLEMNCITRNNL